MSLSLVSKLARRAGSLSFPLHHPQQSMKMLRPRVQSRQYTMAMEQLNPSSLVIPSPSTSTSASVQSLSSLLPQLWNEFTVMIKRTFQPSIIRKRRKTGFLQRQKSVGGRRILERRAKKGRARLGGC
mmetsp:Transcript_16175/g.23635  ORF Transcript_16175/g.23635 Transcript_16175/m.23635 type:complete len:127 (+) Transcript_16175:76-456(+)